jgi:hypothetical protein
MHHVSNTPRSGLLGPLGRALAGVGALLAAMALAACGSTSKHTSSSQRLSSAEFSFLVGYGQTAQDQPVLSQAEQILDQRCMHKAGFRYVVDPSTGSASQEGGGQNHPYIPGVGATRTEALAVAERRQTGYHLYQAYAPSSQTTPANDLYVRSLSPAQQARYSRVLFGPQSQHKTLHLPSGGTFTFPTLGCVAKGQTALYGSPEDAQKVIVLTGDLVVQLGNATTSDPAVAAKSRAWSKCVSAATGVHFAKPHDIIARLQREYAAQPGNALAVRKQEIAYAVADARCQFRTGLASAYAKAFRQQADQIAGPTRRLLLQTLEVERSATQRAERIVSEASAG